MSKQIPCRKMFTSTLLQLAKNDKEIVTVTSDARGSVTLTDFANQLPGQFVECGIAEQNEVGIASGLAAWGKKAFVCAPACFISARSLEQIKVDVAYSNTNVKIVAISGGVSYGALGMSHHSLQDIATMRAIPNMTVMIPSDRWQTQEMTKWMANYTGPVYIRMGRNSVPDIYEETNIPFTIGKANLLKEGDKGTIIASGETVHYALAAACDLTGKGINVRVLDMHTLKPIDEEAIIKAAKETGRIITIEEHSIYGGLGAAVSQIVVENCPVPMRILGIPDEPAVSGTTEEIFNHYGITIDNISKVFQELLNG